MTEYLDDEYGDSLEEDYGLEDEIDELEDRLDEQEINGQIRDLERAAGTSFPAEVAQQVGELLDAGHSPEDILPHVQPPSDFEEDFNATVLREQHKQGRELQQSEVDAMWHEAVGEGDPDHVAAGAIRDLGTRKGRIAHIDERIAEPAEVPETVEPPGPDSTSQDRIAYMDARHGGAQVESTDTYETEGDE